MPSINCLNCYPQDNVFVLRVTGFQSAMMLRFPTFFNAFQQFLYVTSVCAEQSDSPGVKAGHESCVVCAYCPESPTNGQEGPRWQSRVARVFHDMLCLSETVQGVITFSRCGLKLFILGHLKQDSKWIDYIVRPETFWPNGHATTLLDILLLFNDAVGNHCSMVCRLQTGL